MTPDTDLRDVGHADLREACAPFADLDPAAVEAVCDEVLTDGVSGRIFGDPADADTAARFAALPLGRRLLLVAESLGRAYNSLERGLYELEGVYRRAARRFARNPERAAEIPELEGNAAACRKLAGTVALSAQIARELRVDVGAGALFVARSLREAACDPEFAGSRDEVARAEERARELMLHLAAEAARAERAEGRPS